MTHRLEFIAAERHLDTANFTKFAAGQASRFGVFKEAGFLFTTTWFVDELVEAYLAGGGVELSREQVEADKARRFEIRADRAVGSKSYSFVEGDNVAYTASREGEDALWHLRDLEGRLVCVDRYINDVLSGLNAGRLR